ncbi:MAG TPA: transaldolase [Candidatus Dormibacteraeota bacterium]|nr:transaldolase [Candidatus Dormibacteraeota bacterium]
MQRLAELGQSVWIDYLSRELLASGGLARLVRDYAVVGVTSNPTIFQQAISQGDAYDEQLRALLPSGLGAKEAFLELACADVAAACDLLRPVWEQTGGRDGYVSIEVDPNLAYDTLAQHDEATRLHMTIARRNLLVKIPATRPGLTAIEDAIADGRSINVTLVFSVERYVAVARAYLAGLERFRAGGGDVSTVRSVASFFVSRIDTETDRRLDALGAPAELKGKLGIANAKLAYERFRQLFSTHDERWAALAAAGAHPQRCLWASTSTKNPAYRDVRYVEELIGPDTVDTMPKPTLLAFQDHGAVAPTLERGLDDAHRLLERLEAVGVDYDDVVETLEAEGVEKFAGSVSQLYAELDAKRQTLLAAPGKPR